MPELFAWLDVSGLPVLLQLICFLAAGGAGGLLRHHSSEGGLVMPKTREVKGKKLLRLGFLAHLIAGAFFGAAVDGNVATAFFAGVSVPYLAEKYLQRRMNGKK